MLVLHQRLIPLFSSRVMGISCSIVKPKDVAKLHPFLNIHDLVGALHLPADAVVSPPDVNHALAVAAAGRGTGGARHGPVQWMNEPFIGFVSHRIRGSDPRENQCSAGSGGEEPGGGGGDGSRLRPV